MVKIFSLNVRGIAEATKRRAIFDKHRFNADILILHETHSTKECEKLWQNEWGGKAIFAHGTSAARGVAILTSSGIFSCFKNIYTDQEGRVIIIDLEQDSYIITICAIYAPNTDCPRFFQEIDLILKERSEHKIIIGDFNLTLNIELDREKHLQ